MRIYAFGNPIFDYYFGGGILNQWMVCTEKQFYNFPDMLIQCGELETSASDSEMLYLKAKSAGVKQPLSNMAVCGTTFNI